MATRDFPFDTQQKCDFCNTIGAFEFYGDYYCEDCLREDEDDANAPLSKMPGDHNFNWKKP